jgi:hypothetical protein
MLFPWLIYARTLARTSSDQSPVLWDSSEARRPKRCSFQFEKWWLTVPEFRNIVIKAWSLHNRGDSILDHLQDKVRWFRKLPRGWIANFEAVVRK